MKRIGQRGVKRPAKKAVKRPTKKAAKGKATKRAIARNPPGYTYSSRGLYVDVGSSDDVVSANKLTKGLASAKRQITGMIQDIVDAATVDYEISEIEFAASFSADGKFMGFGVGGEATIVIRIQPSR